MIRLLAAIVLAFSLISATPANYSTYVLSPVDEAPQDESFGAFRKKLLHAIERKDSAFLLSVLAPNIAFTFGGAGDGDGPEGFRRMWVLGKHSGKSKVWPLLKKVVTHGGKFNEDHTSFSAPYVSATWPSSYDTFDFIAVVEKDVSVREKPMNGSPEIQKISYEIVRLIAGRKEAPDSWAAIMLPSGQRGFIQNRYLQSAVGYRARFEKAGKEWKLATFIVGN